LERNALTKTCTSCKEEKRIEEFHKNALGRFGKDARCKVCRCEARRARYKTIPDESRAASLKYYHGITIQQYESMAAAQDGVCYICNNTCPSGKRLAVDHCHVTGKIRKLLCTRCNNGLGNFKDEPHLLRLAAEYLEASVTN
jgi:hypothetical protein